MKELNKTRWLLLTLDSIIHKTQGYNGTVNVYGNYGQTSIGKIPVKHESLVSQ